jgi:hypothetical protein
VEHDIFRTRIYDVNNGWQYSPFIFKCRVKLKHPVSANYETKKHEYFTIVSLPIDSVIVDHVVEAVSRGDGESFHIQGISRVIISPAELKKQPTIHFQSERDYFKYRIVL